MDVSHDLNIITIMTVKSTNFLFVSKRKVAISTTQQQHSMQSRGEKEEDDSSVESKWGAGVGVGGHSKHPHSTQLRGVPSTRPHSSPRQQQQLQTINESRDVVDLLPQEYTNWVVQNASVITSIESTLRGLFFLLPAGGGAAGSQDSNKTTILVELGKCGWDMEISRLIHLRKMDADRSFWFEPKGFTAVGLFSWLNDLIFLKKVRCPPRKRIARILKVVLLGTNVGSQRQNESVTTSKYHCYLEGTLARFVDV